MIPNEQNNLILQRNQAVLEQKRPLFIRDAKIEG